MKKITKISAAMLGSFALINLANAATPGGYAGIGLGVSTLRTPDSNYFALIAPGETSRERGGLGGRLFAGYNFNKYFGLEANYQTYTSSIYRGQTGNSSSSLRYSLNAVDVVAKGYLPLDDSGFDVYALAGLAVVNDTVKYNNGGVPFASDITANFNNGSTTYHRLRPVYGLGASYTFNSKVTTSLEFSRIQGNGNQKTSASAIPSADLLTLNLAYNFG